MFTFQVKIQKQFQRIQFDFNIFMNETPNR